MEIDIRRLEARDAADWRRLFRSYIDFYGAAVPEAVIDLTWARLLAGEGGLSGFVAVDEAGCAQGFALLVLHRSTWSPSVYCYLEDLYVAEAARGRGIGRALIAAVYREADARGATRTYWVTETDNATARALYDSVATLQPFVQYRR